jgi:arylsulfatase A-like enzyme
MRDGSFTFLATTTPAAVTLPSHTSMLTGVTIERHGISGNDDEAAANEKLLVPTIFDYAKAAGISTGMASGKSKFSLYDPPIDVSWHPESRMATKVKAGKTISYSAGTVVPDDQTADHAVQIIAQHKPRLMFVHFGWNDSIGHGIGWGSAAQVEGLAKTDQDLGRVFDALRSAGVFDQTDIILSADHGGAGRVHGATVEGSKYIPWLIAGPGIRKGVDLTYYRDWPVRTYDTFATACKILGIKYPADIDGRPVDPAFESFKTAELLSATTRHGATNRAATRPS